MIKLRRAPCPPKLAKGGSNARNRYGHKEVVEALHKMQKGKCCYCETDIPKTGHGKAVEHFRPKAKYKGKRNDWKNLLLCCPQCNGKKSDLFPVILSNSDSVQAVVYLKKASTAQAAILDPTAKEDPEDHLSFQVEDSNFELFGQIYAKNKSKLGQTTIEVVGLYRVDYTKAHREHLLELQLWYTCMLKAHSRNDDVEKSVFESKLRMAVRATSEYAALARAFVKTKRINENGFNVPIPKSAS